MITPIYHSSFMKKSILVLLLSQFVAVLYAGSLPGWSIRSDDSSCSSCTGGDSEFLDVSTFLNIDFGPGLKNNAVGSLVLKVGRPTPQLSTPASLQLIRDPKSTELLDVRLLGGQLHQISAPRVFINITNASDYKYTIRVMLKAAEGSLAGDGFYAWDNNPSYLIREYTVENPDASPSVYNRLRIRDITTGINEWMFSYSNSISGWHVSLPANIGYLEMISTNHAANAWTIISRHRNVSNQTVAERSQVYTNFSWGPAILTNTIGLGSDAQIRRFSYYATTPFSPTVTLRPLMTSEEPDGSWRKIIQYDSQGRILIEHFGIDTGVTDDASLCRKIIYSYLSEDAADDLSRDPDQPRRIDEYWKNVLVKRIYHIYTYDEHRTIECPNPANTINNSENLVSREFFDSGTTRLLRAAHADGTVTIPTTTTDMDGVKTETTDQGEYDSNTSTVVNGTRTETITSPTGAHISKKTWVISQGNITQLIGSTAYTDFDVFQRPTRKVNIDGTFELTSFACCGPDNATDREGVTTQFWYDALKRVVATTRLNITVSNILDVAGRTLATIRIGTDGTRITNELTSYNTAGLLTYQTNGLGGFTKYSQRIINGVFLEKTSITPNGGTITNLFLPSGAISNVAGTGTFPVRYEYGVETDGTVQRLYTKEIKLDLGGNPTSEWLKNYRDGLGRSHLTAYSIVSGVSARVSYFNNKGQLWKEADPDGVTTLYKYNAEGEREYTIVAVKASTRNISTYQILESSFASILAGTDRITYTTNWVETLTDIWPGMIARVGRVYVWGGDNNNTPTLISTSLESIDGLRTSQIVHQSATSSARTSTYTVFSGNNRYLTNNAPDGSSVFSHFQNGRLLSITRRDSAGNQVSKTSYGYDTHGRQNAIIDARNGAITYTFNTADQVATVTTPAPSTLELPQVTATYYNNMMQATNTISPDGGSVINDYYLTGLLKKTYGARNYPVEYTYDYAGRMSTMKTWQDFLNGSPTTTTWNYDVYSGRLANKRYSDGKGPDYIYTPGGRLKTRTWARVGTSSQRIVTTYKYGFDDSVSDNQHGDLTETSYSYDPQSTPSVTTVYDRRGRSSTTTQGSAGTTLTYNDANEMLTESYTGSGTTLNGLSVTNGYDQFLRRTNLTALNGTTVLARTTNSYEAAGRIATISDGVNNVTYGYLANSPLVGIVTLKQNSTTRMTTTKSYDFLNRLTSISSLPSSSSSISSSYKYNQANQRTRNTTADGSYWNYEYDALGQVKRGAKFFSDGYPVPGQQFEYAHDDIGNRKSTKAGGDENGANLRAANYTPNNLNQYSSREVPRKIDVMGLALGTATVTATSPNALNNATAPWRKVEYFRKELSFTANTTPLWEFLTVTATSEANVTGNVFLAGAPEAFEHDADGNLTQDGRWDYTWDAENRLVKMESRSGAPTGSKRRMEFAYDSKARRIWKKVTNLDTSTVLVDNKFVYDGWNLIAVLSSSSSLLSSFTWGLDLSGSIQGAGGVGGLLAVTDATLGTHFCAYDGNGNLTGLVKASDGDVSANYEYGPFGELIRKSGLMANANPFRFSTKYQDDESDMLYYGYRSYNASTGRWLSRDPIEEQGGANLYGFVQNAALNFFDALGLEIQEIVFWTYIEWPTVTDPFKNVFRGDNHAGGAGSFRTIHRILIETCGPKKGLIPGSEWKDTGITELLDPKTGAVLKTGKATGKTLKATVTTGPDTVTVKMEGNETNPLHKHFGISAPAISYHLTIIFNTKTGRATFSGTHDGFPSYQAYSGGKLIRDWSHVQAGTDPWDLRPPEEISFSGGFKIEKCCP